MIDNEETESAKCFCCGVVMRDWEEMCIECDAARYAAIALAKWLRDVARVAEVGNLVKEVREEFDHAVEAAESMRTSKVDRYYRALDVALSRLEEMAAEAATHPSATLRADRDALRAELHAVHEVVAEFERDGDVPREAVARVVEELAAARRERDDARKLLEKCSAAFSRNIYAVSDTDIRVLMVLRTSIAAHLRGAT